MTKHIPFHIDDYIQKKQVKVKKVKTKVIKNTIGELENFIRICKEVNDYIDQEWQQDEGKDSTENLLQYQKRAIIGHSKEVNYFKDKVSNYLKTNGLVHEWHPTWYSDLTTAIFHENWGLSGIVEWKNMSTSSSAKIIGKRIYFLEQGEMKLQEQKISKERLKQLRQALLLPSPETRTDENYAEVIQFDGTRVTIYDKGLAKEPVIIFRKYTVEQLTFEEQAKLGSISKVIIPMLKAMVAIGYNVAFTGAVRTGKTTFLETYQSYEDGSLEGIQVETDPEIPIHLIMPNAPIMQLLANGEKLKRLIPKLMRSDGDYLIMAEARDGIALKIALEITKKGTRRVKITFHTSDPTDFCFDVASEIVQEFGGDLWSTTIKVAKGYHYIFQFVQLKDKSKKRLKGIYELRYNPTSFEITIHQICKYEYATDSWSYKYDIGEDKEDIANEENIDAFHIFRNELKKLAANESMQGNHITELPYFKFLTNGR